MLSWADIIFVMEKKDKQGIIGNFSSKLDDKKMITLEIHDDYKFMNPELIEEI